MGSAGGGPVTTWHRARATDPGLRGVTSGVSDELGLSPKLVARILRESPSSGRHSLASSSEQRREVTTECPTP